MDAPSGRSGATNFFELIGGLFSLWDVGSISNCELRIWDNLQTSLFKFAIRNPKSLDRGPDSGQDFILSSTGNRRERNYLLCVKCTGACTERLIQLVSRNLIGFGQNNRVWNPVMVEPLFHHHVGFRWGHPAIHQHYGQLQLSAILKVAFDHGSPFFLYRFRDLRVSVTWQIDEVRAFVDEKEVDRLCPARR